MTLYTMSGKRTTIEERDSTSEEERMAEIRARLFNLFDDDEEREREYDEQNRLKNRATGVFKKIRSTIGDAEDGHGGGADSRGGEGPRGQAGARGGEGQRGAAGARSGEGPRGAAGSRGGEGSRSAAGSRGGSRGQAQGAQGGGSGPARRGSGRPEQQGGPGQRRSGQEAPDRESRGEEQSGRNRIEQARIVKPVNPVRAMDAEKLGRRGLPPEASADGDAQSAGRPRRPKGSAAPDPGTAGRSPESRPAAKSSQGRPSPGSSSAGSVAGGSPAGSLYQGGSEARDVDTSFRLGDLFRDEEPGILSSWDREDEEERRIHERRERRRAEAARRVHGSDDDSKMKTAAAIFIAREGMKNFFGKFSGGLGRDEAREEEEREAEKAIRDIAAASTAENAKVAQPAASAPQQGRPESADAASAGAGKPAGVTMPEQGAGEPVAGKSATEPTASEPAASTIKTGAGDPPTGAATKPAGDAAKGKRAVSDIDGAAGAEDESEGAGISALPRRSARRAARADSDEGYDSASAPIYSGLSAHLNRTSIAWIAGGAAGAVAVVIISFMISNSHIPAVSSNDIAPGYESSPGVVAAADM
jgi:hypothetical protein